MVAFSYHLKAIVVQCGKLLFQNDQREFVCGVDWLLTCPLAAVGHSEKCNQEVFRLLLGDLPCPSPLKVLRNATSLFRPFYKALLPRRCPKSSRKCSWLVETCRTRLQVVGPVSVQVLRFPVSLTCSEDISKLSLAFFYDPFQRSVDSLLVLIA